MQYGKGDATRLLNRRITSGQSERPETSDPLERIIIRQQKLPAPDRAVRAIASAVPRHTQRWSFHLILGHACQNVGPMMLDTLQRGPDLSSIARGKVIRMKVARDQIRFRPIKAS